MRLLNVNTLELKLFAGNQIPAYAILSHTWDEEEITFEDIANESIASESAAARCKSGFSKIKGTCERAAYHGYQWVWIDSCCIDKSSSAELQEAINSMWNWYKNANVCYAYLAGVPNRLSGWSDQFRRSRWFTRGWTLQELIAPWSVEFYAADWSQIGTKLRRLDEIHNITGISKITLKTSNPEYERVAEVMSWAAHRNVTREEDLAYSLMGLFDINMPMLYGEGSTKAFLRLQEEIFKRRPDHSLFLYTYSSAVSSASLLAESPTQFCRSLGCSICPEGAVQLFPKTIQYYELQNRPLWPSQHRNHTTYDQLFIRQGGQETTLVLIDKEEAQGKVLEYSGEMVRDTVSDYIALLHVTNRYGQYFALILHSIPNEDNHFERVRGPVVLFIGRSTVPEPRRAYILSNRALAQNYGMIMSSRHSIELKSSTFKIKHLEPSSFPWQENSLLDQGIELHSIRLPWQCRFVVCNPENDRWLVRLSVQSSNRAPEDCRIIQVAVNWNPNGTFTTCTPEDYSSDQFDLHLDGQSSFLVSIRRLPTQQTQGTIFSGLTHRHQLEIERVSPLN